MHQGDKTAGKRKGRMKDAGKPYSRAGGKREDVGVRDKENNFFFWGVAIVFGAGVQDILSCFEILFHRNIASSE